MGKRFFRKNLDYAQRVADKKVNLRNTLDEESKSIVRTHFDRETGKTVTYKDHPKQIRTPQEELEFFDRIDNMLKKREEKLKILDDKVYKEKCPHKPTIMNKYKSQENKDDDNEEDEEVDPTHAFLKRYAEDLETRRDKNPSKYIRSKSVADDTEPFRMSKKLDSKSAIYLWWNIFCLSKISQYVL